MQNDDLAKVNALADSVHPDHPEDDAIFAERLRLYPAGCYVLIEDETTDEIAGYALTHPWLFGQPPPLNSLLGKLPDVPDTLYVHDVALAPTARGQNAGHQLVDALKQHAIKAQLPDISLISLGKSVGFWLKNGFRPLSGAIKSDKLASYGKDACFMTYVLSLEGLKVA